MFDIIKNITRNEIVLSILNEKATKKIESYRLKKINKKENFTEDFKKIVKETANIYSENRKYLIEQGFTEEHLDSAMDVKNLTKLRLYMKSEKMTGMAKSFIETTGKIDLFINANTHYEKVKNVFKLTDDFETFLEKILKEDNKVTEKALSVIENLGIKLAEKKDIKELKGHHQIRNIKYIVGKEGVYIDTGKEIARGGGKKIHQLKMIHDIASNAKILLESHGDTENADIMKEEISIINELNDKGIRYILPKVHDEGQREDEISKETYGVQDNLGNLTGKRFFASKMTDSSEFLVVISQLLVGYSDIQKENYVVGDIKPANIMIRVGDNKEACIIDLGGAKKLKDEKARPGFITQGYMAPEFDMDNPVITKKSDSFAFGVTLLQGITKHLHVKKLIGTDAFNEKYSFSSKYVNKVIHECKSALEKGECSDKDRDILNGLLEICQKLLEPDPEKRLSFDDGVIESQTLVKNIDSKYSSKLEERIKFTEKKSNE